MRTLENNDWIFLNSVIFRVHSIDDSIEMCRTLLEQLRMMLDFDSATFYVSSPEDSSVLVDPVVYNITPDLGEKYIRETDIVVFDRNTIEDKAQFPCFGDTFTRPEGIDAVIVNGRIAVENKEVFEEKSGRILRGVCEKWNWRQD